MQIILYFVRKKGYNVDIIRMNSELNNMNNVIPRVAAVHDLSGFGKCSLTVVLPIMSAMGIEVCPLPTAVLSTHTGGFDGYTLLDMTEEMKGIIKHWKTLDIKFNAVYSGFLGSAAQVDILINFIKEFKHDKLLTVVDPVLGDNGRLYSTMDIDMVNKMRELISAANVITPNITEAAFLLGEKYCLDIIPEEVVFDWAKRLSALGAQKIVITSVMDEHNNMSVVIYDSETDKLAKLGCLYTKGVFHGTGDVFTGVLTSKLLYGATLENAARTAIDFTSAAIKETAAHPEITTREGILFEKILAGM